MQERKESENAQENDMSLFDPNNVNPDSFIFESELEALADQLLYASVGGMLYVGPENSSCRGPWFAIGVNTQDGWRLHRIEVWRMRRDNSQREALRILSAGFRGTVTVMDNVGLLSIIERTSPGVDLSPLLRTLIDFGR